MDTAAERRLLHTIRQRLPELEALLARATSDWEYDDFVYRFDHHSWSGWAAVLYLYGLR